MSEVYHTNVWLQIKNNPKTVFGQLWTVHGSPFIKFPKVLATKLSRSDSKTYVIM
jgi:hypothetical protein